MFRIGRPKQLKLDKREYVYLVLYTVVIATTSVAVHEAAHIVAALAFGVPFNELRLGLLG